MIFQSIRFSSKPFHASLLALSVVFLTCGSALGQTLPLGEPDAEKISIDIEDPESKAAVRELVSTLSDDAVRALLIERMDAVAEEKQRAAAEDVSALGLIERRFANYWVYARDSAERIGTLPAVFSKIRKGIQSATDHSVGKVLLIVLLSIALGVFAERVVAWFFRKRKQHLIDSFSTKLWGILKILYTRLSYDVLGVVAYGIVSAVVIRSFYPEGTIMNQLVEIFTVGIFGGWLAYVICRFFFAPSRPDLRICRTTDERAWKITVSFSLTAAFIVTMHNIFYLFIQVGETYYDGYNYMRTLGYWMNISIYIVAAFAIWINRDALSEILLENKKRVSLVMGEEAPENLSWFAAHWPKIAVLLILAKYLLVELVVNNSDVAVYSTSAVYITFIVIFLWPGIDANVSLFVGKGVTAAEDETPAAAKARRNMQSGLLRVGRVLVVGVVFYALASLWGLNIMDLANSGLGAKAAGTLVEFLLIVLIAYISWELVSAFVGYWLAAESGSTEDAADEGGGEIGGVGLSRTATLLPIIKKTAQVLIVIVSIIMVLDNWGVNIGPILAGAGVVGLAIGFGAQTLVKDIVSGLFFLADDAFRVGEYIDVGGTMGTVEKISLRSLRLRHHRGLVHTIPYGEIPKLTNYSRDWVIMKLRFRVPFETDINKVKKIFKSIGADLLNDPVLGDDFLEPFKSQGVAEVDDNGMVVRGKFMAKPGKQFMIRKEVYVRVQKAFEEAGIPFARKQVMVHIPGLDKNESVDEELAREIGAAAADAAEDPIETDQNPTKKTE
ncbi:MAG: mechanosensitive ion channel family protein [Pseudomonadota bacterium]